MGSKILPPLSRLWQEVHHKVKTSAFISFLTGKKSSDPKQNEFQPLSTDLH
jgi:hypothetical protein